MRLPAKPPSIMELIQEANQKTFLKISRPEVATFVRSVNDKYMPWDKLRYHGLPAECSAREAWMAIIMSRQPQRRPIPISFYQLAEKVSFWLPPKQLEWLHRIDRSAGGMQKGGELPDDDRYLFSSLMEEAIASSLLEGASTTREVAKKMLRAGRKPKTVSEVMVANNYNAILDIRDSKGDKLTPELLTHFQDVLTTGTLDDPSKVGRLRTDEDKVIVVECATGDALHTPPGAASLPVRIKQLCDFANKNQDVFIHPVIKAIVLHFAVGFIHPFVDGNGRTARALFYWFMLKSGYWAFEYLPISRIFLRSPAKYARAYLNVEADGGDLGYFIHYNLLAIIHAIDELHTYLRSQRREMHSIRTLLRDHPSLNNRQSALLYDCLKNSGIEVTIRQFASKHRVAYVTARNDLLALEELGFLERGPGKYRLTFSAIDNLQSKLRAATAANNRKAAT
jgi:Fic family protein